MKYIKKFKTVNLLFLLKTGIGSAIAILIAGGFGLAYSPSAGIITLLTIQSTKKETIFIAAKRFLAFLLAIATAFLAFKSFGYTPVAFGGFVFLFVALCNLLGLKDGISMNAVLMTHFLIERRMDLGLILNEIALLAIGMGIGIILNLIMPRYREKIRREQRLLEEEMKVALKGMSGLLKEKEACLIQGDEKEISYVNRMDELHNSKVDFSRLDQLLEELIKKAYEDAGNTLLSNTKYLVSYLEMRKLQIGVLKEITKNILQIPVLLRQTFPIADFIEHIGESFHELNNVQELLKELEVLQEHYRKEKLPQSREEFEYRAILYQILKELGYFLQLKRDFILKLEDKNMKLYWG